MPHPDGPEVVDARAEAYQVPVPKVSVPSEDAVAVFLAWASRPCSYQSPRLTKRGWAAKRHPDLTKVILIVCGDLVEFIPQRPHAIYTMHPLQVTTPLVVLANMIDDGVADRFVDVPSDVERDLRIVESLRPRILLHHRENRSRLAQHSMDAIEKHSLAVGKMVQDIPH
jgi:hypothetical protein